MTPPPKRSADAERLLAAARELADMALEIRATGQNVATAAARPGLPSPVRYRLLRAVGGLGGALPGTRLGTLSARVAGMVGAESVTVRLLAASLRLRIAAVTLDNPGLAADPVVGRLVTEIADDRHVQAARTLRGLLRERGTLGAVSAIAPVFSELLALNALLDGNPLNDRTAWLIATGTGTASADPLSGMSNMAVAVLDKGTGAVRPEPPRPGETARLSTEGALLAFLTNIAVLGTTGRVLIQSVTGPDGVTRHVLQAPGMSPGGVNDSPQDLLGAFSSTLIADSPYARALARAVADYGVPEGAEIALVGHSAGGAAVMNLAARPDFAARHKVTHVIAVGSPIDFKTPADPATRVASIANQNDIIPSLDGQGAGNCFDLHPDWYVVDYPSSGAPFPACHSIENYITDITDHLPEAHARIDGYLTPYKGPVTRTAVYRVYDRAPRPEGFPFLTVPTHPVPCAGATVELPIRSSAADAFTAYFAADTDAVHHLLKDTGLTPVTVGRHCLVALHAFHHPAASVGPHRRLDLAVAVHDPWEPHPLRAWTDLLRPVDRRRGGSHVTAALIDAPPARAAAHELWGHPVHDADLDVTVGRRAIRLTATTDDERLLSLTGSLGPTLPFAACDQLTYSHLAGTTLRSGTELRGGGRLHPAPTLRLRTGTAHPLAQRLRTLGLDNARPLLCLSARSCQIRINEGVPVQIT